VAYERQSPLKNVRVTDRPASAAIALAADAAFHRLCDCVSDVIRLPRQTRLPDACERRAPPHGMMVESVDTTDFDWSRRSGNGCRDALKFGEPSAYSVATPNQVVASRFSVGQKA